MNIQDEELAFLGKIIASLSHELNNVLSIINEYSGLLNDLACTSSAASPLDCERVKEITNSLTKQITREKQLIKLLNRFAHRLDKPIIEFDLNNLVSDMVRISRRFASQKKVSLEFSQPDDEILLTNNPFRIQFLIFLCLTSALNTTPTNEVISCYLENYNDHYLLRISSRITGIVEESLTDKELIAYISQNVKANVTYELTNKSCGVIKLQIPLVT
jgi:C4-dicarboxylate-specific signal transduction histidine kinase